jgi:hypothetical protein
MICSLVELINIFRGWVMMRAGWHVRACVAVAAITGGLAATAAAEATGTVTGAAQTGAVLPGVTVTVKCVQTGATGVRDERGRLYTAPLLQPGDAKSRCAERHHGAGDQRNPAPRQRPSRRERADGHQRRQRKVEVSATRSSYALAGRAKPDGPDAGRAAAQPELRAARDAIGGRVERPDESASA